MLESLAHLPRRTKLSLRNYLTRRYPAVPIPSAVMKRAKEIQSRKDYESDLNNEADCIDAGDDLTYIGEFCDVFVLCNNLYHYYINIETYTQ
jgi:hypothetical protein